MSDELNIQVSYTWTIIYLLNFVYFFIIMAIYIQTEVYKTMQLNVKMLTVNQYGYCV